MANDENLRRLTPSEAREYGRRGGKASGASRRKNADFRKTLNALLTAEIYNPEWTSVLEALGLESTLESALNMAMIKEGLAGNVKAYEAIAKYAGQTDKTDADQSEQTARTEQLKTNTDRMRRETGPEAEDGVEIINDAPKETD